MRHHPSTTKVHLLLAGLLGCAIGLLLLPSTVQAGASDIELFTGRTSAEPSAG